MVLTLLLANVVLAALEFVPAFSSGPGSGMNRLRFWTGAATIVAWLWWLPAAHRNLRAMGTPPQWHGVLFAWFVPVLNLVRPYRIVGELWTKSRPEAGMAVVQIWWTACLGWVAFRMLNLAFTGNRLFEDFAAASAIDYGAKLAGLAAPLAAYVIVRGVSAVQATALTRTSPVTGLGGLPLPTFALPAAGKGIVGLATLALLFSTGILEPSPEQSLRALAEAYEDHDVARFRSYCNLNSIIDNAVEQGLTSETFGTWLSGRPASESLAHRIFGGLIAKLLTTYYTPGLSERLEGMLVTGVIPDDRYYANPYGDFFFRTYSAYSDNIRAGLAERIFGVEVVKRFARTAIVRVGLRSGRKDGPAVAIFLKMVRVQNHWQIIAIRDIHALTPSPTPSRRPGFR